MKTATLPSIRVEPEFRDQLEGVLGEGETVSAFIEASVRQALRKRKLDAEFHARAQAAVERYKSGDTPGHMIDDVMAELRAKLEHAKTQVTAAAGHAKSGK
jgi:hypothetical protein